MGKSTYRNLVGEKFGMLTVIERAEDSYLPNGETRRKWKCRCDCGNEVVRHETTLKNKNHLHCCGCVQRAKLKPQTDKKLLSRAGKRGIQGRMVNGVNMLMLDNDKNISTNTSGHKGVSYQKNIDKWRAYVGYKNHRYTLIYDEDIEVCIKIRQEAVQAIYDGCFEEYYYCLTGKEI